MEKFIEVKNIFIFIFCNIFYPTLFSLFLIEQSKQCLSVLNGNLSSHIFFHFDCKTIWLLYGHNLIKIKTCKSKSAFCIKHKFCLKLSICRLILLKRWREKYNQPNWIKHRWSKKLNTNWPLNNSFTVKQAPIVWITEKSNLKRR